MAKKYVVTIGYNKLVAPNKEAAFNILECYPIESHYIDGKTIYTLEVKTDVKVELIDEELIRPFTRGRKRKQGSEGCTE